MEAYKDSNRGPLTLEDLSRSNDSGFQSYGQYTGSNGSQWKRPARSPTTVTFEDEVRITEKSEPIKPRSLSDKTTTIQDMKLENDILVAENNLLRRQLYLVKQNTGLRVVNMVSDALSWIDCHSQMNYGDLRYYQQKHTTQSSEPTRRTPIQSPATTPPPPSALRASARTPPPVYSPGIDRTTNGHAGPYGEESLTPSFVYPSNGKGRATPPPAIASQPQSQQQQQQRSVYTPPSMQRRSPGFGASRSPRSVSPASDTYVYNETSTTTKMDSASPGYEYSSTTRKVERTESVSENNDDIPMQTPPRTDVTLKRVTSSTKTTTMPGDISTLQQKQVQNFTSKISSNNMSSIPPPPSDYTPNSKNYSDSSRRMYSATSVNNPANPSSGGGNRSSTPVDYGRPPYSGTNYSVQSLRQSPAVDNYQQSNIYKSNSSNFPLYPIRPNPVSPSGSYTYKTIGRSRVPMNKRIIGEIAFQLDRRILNFVFGDGNKNNKTQQRYQGGEESSPNNEPQDHRKRFYGYLIQNIQEKIVQESTNPYTKVIDHYKRSNLNLNYTKVLNTIQPLGFDLGRHPELTMKLVNKYGLLPLPANRGNGEGIGAELKGLIKDVVVQVTPAEEIKDVLILLDCLAHMAMIDGKPMMVF